MKNYKVLFDGYLIKGHIFAKWMLIISKLLFDSYLIENNNMDNITEKASDIIMYQTEDGLTKINVKLDNETVWLNQQQLVLLYQSSKSNISEHIKHIIAEGELDENSVVRKFRTTADDGKNYGLACWGSLFGNRESHRQIGEEKRKRKEAMNDLHIDKTLWKKWFAFSCMKNMRML